MFVRIVKLSFQWRNIPAFLENFESIKKRIRSAPGNRLLELYQDKDNKSIFLRIAIGKPKKIWKITEILSF
jgi:quinol monooxygenase YgiN